MQVAEDTMYWKGIPWSQISNSSRNKWNISILMNLTQAIFQECRLSFSGLCMTSAHALNEDAFEWKCSFLRHWSGLHEAFNCVSHVALTEPSPPPPHTHRRFSLVRLNQGSSVHKGSVCSGLNQCFRIVSLFFSDPYPNAMGQESMRI